MKSTAKTIVTVVPVLVVVTLFMSSIDPAIPTNPGGNVDVEIQMGRVSLPRGPERILTQLSDVMVKHPEAKKIRIRSRWADCGVMGKRVVVYDRSSLALMDWVEGKHFKMWRGFLRNVTYGGVQENLVRELGRIEYENWRYARGKNAGQFDFLQDYGCTKQNLSEVKPIRFQ